MSATRNTVWHSLKVFAFDFPLVIRLITTANEKLVRLFNVCICFSCSSKMRGALHFHRSHAIDEKKKTFHSFSLWINKHNESCGPVIFSFNFAILPVKPWKHFDGTGRKNHIVVAMFRGKWQAIVENTCPIGIVYFIKRGSLLQQDNCTIVQLCHMREGWNWLLSFAQIYTIKTRWFVFCKRRSLQCGRTTTTKKGTKFMLRVVGIHIFKKEINGNVAQK